MSTQQPTPPWDDGIGLRVYVDVLVHQKWLILALIAGAVLITGLINYLVLPPVYQSSVVVTLPTADGQNGLGMTPQAYEQFATSKSVKAAVRQELNIDPIFSRIPTQYTLQLNTESRLLTVTAAGQTADDALRLARLWVKAFYEQVQVSIQQQLAEQKDNTEQAVAILLSELTAAEETLSTFDQETPLSLREARLTSLAEELVGRSGQTVGKAAANNEENVGSPDRFGAEQRLSQLTSVAIPVDEERLAFLEGALAREPETLSGTDGTVTLPGGDSGAGVTSSNVTILNPVYLQLSQDVVTTRTRLVTNLAEADVLRERIPSLQDKIDQLGKDIVTSKTDRQRLDRVLKESQELYQTGTSELGALLAIERRLPELSRPGIVSEPVIPDAPIAPRKALNVTLAGLAAALLGVVIAFFLEKYRSEAATGSVIREESVAGQVASDK